MQGTQNQVAREGRLNRHIRGFQITDLPDHDDIGILTHQRAHTGGKIEVNSGVNLHLVEGWLNHLYGVFNRTDIDIGSGQPAQRRVQRRGLARACWAGHQDDARTLLNHALPSTVVITAQAQFFKTLQQDIGIKDTHHELFAKGRRQGG